MKKDTLFAAIDVDDAAFHGAGVVLKTGELFEFKCKPDGGALLGKLRERFGTRYEIRLCYEASYIGYTLCRFLRKSGIHCDIVAPSLIPVKAGERVKTVRSRGFLVRQRKMLKTHILSTCTRYGIKFREETGRKTNFTDVHISWLKKRAKTLQRPVCQLTLELLLSQYTAICESIETLDATIARIVAENERYRKLCGALCAFRGIDTLSAMTLVSEIGDIRRFAHPRQLTSYVGLDVAEYSSGGKQRKKGITKTGNWHIRTTLTEACQIAYRSPILSTRLKQSRANQPPEIVDVASRCMHRLHKKGTRMLYAGKHKNKIKTACAREMLGFIWEAMRLAA